MRNRPTILERNSASGLTFPVARVQEPLKSAKKENLVSAFTGFALTKGCVYWHSFTTSR